MALTRTATGPLRVGRPEMTSAATSGRRFLSALSAVDRKRTNVASAAATSARPYLAMLSAEDRERMIRMERDIEMRVRASMEIHFDTRVRDIVERQVKDIIRSEAADINSGLDIQLLLENAASKQTLSFQKELSAEKMKYEEKVESLVKNHGNASNEMKLLIAEQKTKCERRADAADNKYDLLRQTHADFKEISNAAVQKTQYDLMKLMAGGISGVAIVGLYFYWFH